MAKEGDGARSARLAMNAMAVVVAHARQPPELPNRTDLRLLLKQAYKAVPLLNPFPGEKYFHSTGGEFVRRDGKYTSLSQERRRDVEHGEQVFWPICVTFHGRASRTESCPCSRELCGAADERGPGSIWGDELTILCNENGRHETPFNSLIFKVSRSYTGEAQLDKLRDLLGLWPKCAYRAFDANGEYDKMVICVPIEKCGGFRPMNEMLEFDRFRREGHETVGATSKDDQYQDDSEDGVCEDYDSSWPAHSIDL